MLLVVSEMVLKMILFVTALELMFATGEIIGFNNLKALSDSGASERGAQSLRGN